jgi:hypothetical protein
LSRQLQQAGKAPFFDSHSGIFYDGRSAFQHGSAGPHRAVSNVNTAIEEPAVEVCALLGVVVHLQMLDAGFGERVPASADIQRQYTGNPAFYDVSCSSSRITPSLSNLNFSHAIVIICLVFSRT